MITYRKVTEAMREQMETLGHVSNIYYHHKLQEYAEKLTNEFPGNLKVVYFVNSGSEANDLAILLARLHTGNYDVISLMNGYHGLTCQIMGVTAQSFYKHAVPNFTGIHHVSFLLSPFFIEKIVFFLNSGYES